MPAMERGWCKKLGLALVLMLVLAASRNGASGQDPCLSLGLPGFTNNQLQFALQGQANVSYIVESSMDLQTWAPVITNSSSSATQTTSARGNPL